MINRSGKVLGVVFGAAVDDVDTGFVLTGDEVSRQLAKIGNTQRVATGACILMLFAGAYRRQRSSSSMDSSSSTRILPRTWRSSIADAMSCGDGVWCRHTRRPTRRTRSRCRLRPRVLLTELLERWRRRDRDRYRCRAAMLAVAGARRGHDNVTFHQADATACRRTRRSMRRCRSRCSNSGGHPAAIAELHRALAGPGGRLGCGLGDRVGASRRPPDAAMLDAWDKP